MYSCLLSLKKKRVKFKMYEILIFNVVLCGCRILSLMLRNGQILGVFENRVLRRMFEPQREEVTRSWRQQNNEDFHHLY
jgi:hypothetical protein